MTLFWLQGGACGGDSMALLNAEGLPIVASCTAAIPELVEDGVTGLLVPPGDPGALTAALKRLRDQPELRVRLGAAGRRRAAEYGWERTRRGFLEVLEPLLQCCAR